MTRGKKPTDKTLQAPETTEVSSEAFHVPERAMRLAAEQADINAHAVAKRLGYEGSLTVGSLEDEIRFFQRRSVEAVLELGKRLLVLRELTPHGEFAQRIDLLGITDRMGQKLMSATLKFSNAPSTALLKAAGTQAKMLELLALDDGEIEELNDGKSVRGLKLEKIETMTVRELRAALREAKANEVAHEKIIAGKDKLANELEKRLRRVETEEPDERLAAIRGELLGYAVEIEGGIENRLRPAFKALKEHIAAQGGNVDDYLAGCLGQIEQRLRDLRQDHGLIAADVAAWAK